MSEAHSRVTMLDDLLIEEIRAQLAVILESPDFVRSPRIQAFLRFIVEETLEKRSEYLKGYSIALAVFGRDEAFDPSSDPLVRVQGVRLRRMLEQYYLTLGKADTIRITLPKGSYVPLFCRQQPAKKTSVSDPVPTKKSVEQVAPDPFPVVAVLPFENLSRNPDQDYFSDGLSEEIITGLSYFQELSVLSRHVSFAYRGMQFEVCKLRSDIGADYLLEGSVRRVGSQIRVTARLLETTSGKCLWSEVYDRKLTVKKIFDLQADISNHVVAAIAVPFGVIQRTKRTFLKRSEACSLNAYELVLRFYQYWNGAFELHNEIRQGLEHCIKSGENFSCAWAALAFLYLDEYRFHINPRFDAEPPQDRALIAAQKAVDLNSNCPMAYQALFCIHFHRNEIDDFYIAGERALQLNPNHCDMLADFGVDLYCIGDRERGLALSEKAIRLSPVHPGWYHGALCVHWFWIKDYKKALVELRKFNMPQVFIYPVLLSGTYAHLGRHQEAKDAVTCLTQYHPTFVINPHLELNKWNIDEDLIDSLLEGLRLAGMEL